MKYISRILMLALSVAAAAAHADEAAIRKALNGFMPKEKIDEIKPAEVKGLYEVRVGANIFYVSDDGKYFMQGQLYDTEARKNLTESELDDVRRGELDKVGADKMIVFKPEHSKYQVSIFTDIDCGYCRKLHSEIDQYLAEGITVRYLFFPRAGKGSDSYNKAVTVWCSPDRNQALTAAKKNEKMDTRSCDNPIDQHMALGEDFGMNGTPMIVTEKGTILPGYVPAAKLAGILAKEKATP